MPYILGYCAVRIAEGMLSQIERDAMFQLVLLASFFVPFKADLGHRKIIILSKGSILSLVPPRSRPSGGEKTD